jgi:hypothetical protein
VNTPIRWLGVAVVLLGSGAALACNDDDGPSGPGPAAKLAVQAVANQTARTDFSAPVTVEIQDASGDLVTTATNNVTLALGTNPGTILWHVSGYDVNQVLEMVDPGSPAVIAGPVISFAAEFAALAYNSATGLLMGTDRDDNLLTIDPATGIEDTVGTVGVDYVTGLAYELGAAPRLLAVTFDGDLYSLNQATGAATSLGAMTLAGETITGGTGLATDPTNGTIYASLTLVSSTGRNRTLVTINPTTLVATAIAQLGQDGMADLAFSADGTLYGVTGDGGTTPETLYTIDKATGATTLVIALGNGLDGESIAAVPAQLSGTLTVAAVDGVATFPALQINAAANGYTIAATATGLTAATSAAFNVAP